MFIACSGQNQKMFGFLHRIFSDKNDVFVFCSDGLNLLQKLIFEKAQVDLILLEYNFYKSFSDLIFNLLESKNLKIPIIFIGESNYNKSERLKRWIAENEFQYNIQNLHLLLPIFNKINAALDDEDVKNLFMNAKDTTNYEFLPVKSPKKNLLENLRKKVNFSPAVYNLLSFLYKNRCREVSLEEIVCCLNLSAEAEKNRKNAAYSYISRLRKSLENVSLCTIKLIRTRVGYYRLILH